jgi:hypothetical protein
MPVKNRSPPVTKYTMAATIIAGISTINSFIRTIIIKPIITRTTRNGMLIEPSPKLLRTEYIIGKNNAKFIS